MIQIYKNARLGNTITDIIVKDGIIVGLEKTDAKGIDLNGMSARPGLIDIHTHGCVNCDTMDGNGLLEMAKFQAAHGITSFAPTTMTADIEHLKQITNVDIKYSKGANILGFHLEGPYISEIFKGAQNSRYICNPSISEFSKLKNVIMVTLAPELDGSISFIKSCGCKVCLGHTQADFVKASEAFDAGANCVTHMFNAMPPLLHREPSVVGAAFEKNAFVQIICDGIHIHSSVVKMVHKLFGTKRMILISDSMRATGLGNGEFDLGGQKVTVRGKEARLSDGTLAGSVSSLADCVRKSIEIGIDTDDAWRMASETPGEFLGIKKGRIEIGYDADFVVTDENLNILKTIIGGYIRDN